MKELTPRQKKSQHLKRRIYDVFCQLTAENEGNVTIKDICDRAGISVGSFYHLFESKEAVTEELYRYQSEDLAQRVYSDDPDEKIMAVLQDVLHISMEKGVHFMKMATVYETQHTPSIARTRSDGQIFTSTTSELLIQALEQGRAMGRYRLTRPAWYYSDMMIFLFRSVLFFWQVSDGKFDAAATLKNYIETFLDMLRETYARSRIQRLFALPLYFFVFAEGLKRLNRELGVKRGADIQRFIPDLKFLVMAGTGAVRAEKDICGGSVIGIGTKVISGIHRRDPAHLRLGIQEPSRSFLDQSQGSVVIDDHIAEYIKFYSRRGTMGGRQVGGDALHAVFQKRLQCRGQKAAGSGYDRMVRDDIERAAGVKGPNTENTGIKRTDLAADDALEVADDLASHQRGIHAAFRRGTMGGFAVDVDLEHGRGGHCTAGTIVDRAGRLQRGHVLSEKQVHMVCGALLYDMVRASAAFLRRLKDTADRPLKKIPVGGQQMDSAHQHGRVAVMAAGVHDLRDQGLIGEPRCLLDREGVHIGPQAHALSRWPPLDLNHKAGGIEPVIWQAQLLRLSFKPLGGAELLIPQLWVLMQIMPKGYDKILYGFCLLKYCFHIDRSPFHQAYNAAKNGEMIFASATETKVTLVNPPTSILGSIWLVITARFSSSEMTASMASLVRATFTGNP